MDDTIIWEDMGDGSYEGIDIAFMVEKESVDYWLGLLPTLCQEIENMELNF